MLVLSRRESETIFFPDMGISLEIVRVKGNTVRIGIVAPREVRVLRGELLEKNQGQCADGYSREFGTEPAVRESKSCYHTSRNSVDLGVDAAHDKIAC